MDFGGDDVFFSFFFSKFFSSFFAFVFSKGQIVPQNHPSVATTIHPFDDDDDETNKKKRRAQTAGFEPTHALRIRFLVEPLNRSGTSANN